MIGIVGHVNRLEMAEALAGQVGAEYISVDDGTLGCEGNHRKVWTHLAANCLDDWALVLEDDAQPVEDFREQLTEALTVTPSPVVSLYLGNPSHWWWYPNRKQSLTRAGEEADRTGASWILTDDILHGVGIAIRTSLIPAMLTHIAASTLPIDYAIRSWCRTEGMQIAFTWPSLVDHHDGQTLIRHLDGHPRTRARKAWRTGTQHWTPTAVNV